MDKDKIVLQAKIYLYHLNNSTKENGLKTGESWKICQVNDAGRLAIEHDYYPTVSTKVLPKVMQDFTDNLLFLLGTSHTSIPVKERSIESVKGADYLIAYSAERPRR